MQKVEAIAKAKATTSAEKLPVSVIVAARNEEKNLPRCLEALRNVGEVYVIDSAEAPMPLRRSRDLLARRWCSFTIRADGPRSVNGRWKLCHSRLTGFFWLTRMKHLRRN